MTKKTTKKTGEANKAAADAVTEQTERQAFETLLQHYVEGLPMDRLRIAAKQIKALLEL
jgi:hypothetical protein